MSKRNLISFIYVLVVVAVLLVAGLVNSALAEFEDDEVFDSGLEIHKVNPAPQVKKPESKPAPVVRARRNSGTAWRRPVAKPRRATATAKPVKSEEKKATVKPKPAVAEKPVESTIINSMLADMQDDDKPDLAKESEETPGDQAEPVKAEHAESGIAEKTEKNFPARSEHAIKKSEQVLPFGTAPAAEAPSFLRLFVSTLVVVGFILLLAYLWRLLQSRNIRIFTKTDLPLRVVSQQLIGARSRILIVEALGKKFLVGATPERIQLLADLDLFGAEAPVTATGAPEHDESDFHQHIMNQIHPEKPVPEAPLAEVQSSGSFASEKERVAARIREKLKGFNNASPTH